MQRVLLIFGIILTSTNALLSCSCYWNGSFTQIVKNTTDLVAVATVEKYLKISDLDSSRNVVLEDQIVAMKVRITQLIKGEEERDEIIVYGDNGYRCRPYIDANFQIGRSYLVSLHRASELGEIRYESSDNYVISICGEYWLPYDEKTNSVTGVIIGKRSRRNQRTRTLTDIISILRNRGVLETSVGGR